MRYAKRQAVEHPSRRIQVGDNELAVPDALGSRDDLCFALTRRQLARPGCLTTLEPTRRRDRLPIQDRALAPTFIRRCTSEHRNEPIAFPKLNVVLVMHFLGAAPRRLLVNAVELCSADHLPAAVHHEHLVPHDAVRSKRVDHHRTRMSGQGSAKRSATQRNHCTCGRWAIPMLGGMAIASACD